MLQIFDNYRAKCYFSLTVVSFEKKNASKAARIQKQNSLGKFQNSKGVPVVILFKFNPGFGGVLLLLLLC
jgi:hypothetical protein